MALDVIAQGLEEDRRRAEVSMRDEGRYWRDRLYDRFLGEHFRPIVGELERYSKVLLVASSRTREVLRRLEDSR